MTCNATSPSPRDGAREDKGNQEYADKNLYRRNQPCPPQRLDVAIAKSGLSHE